MGKSIVVYASCGEGHKKAAQAVSERFHLNCYDLFDFSNPFIRSFYSKGYKFLVKRFPLGWGLLYLLGKFPLFSFSLKQGNRFVFHRFIRFLKRTRPAVVITTHFFPIPLVCELKEQLGIRLITIITDFGVHPVWVDSRVNHYMVVLAQTKNELVRRGIPPRRIEVAGLPIRKGFMLHSNKESIRGELQFDKKPVLLICSTALRNIPFLKHSIRKLLERFNLIIIYGKDKKVGQYLKKIKHPSLRIFSYYESIWELMDIACAVVTKPGGLTVYEALFKKKPLIFTHFIYGQEKKNLDVIRGLGVGFYAPRYRDFEQILLHLPSLAVYQQEISVSGEKIFKSLSFLIDSQNNGFEDITENVVPLTAS